MKRDFPALGRDPFDLLIVGGGIYGAWAAYDAAARGLRVALVERDDWAAGTSSASSKLIHGGLRYLETFEFGLVRHSLHERKRLLHWMPHQVRPLGFVIPLHRRGRFGRLRTKAGLLLYDLLAGGGRATTPHRTLAGEPLAAATAPLARPGLRGAFLYDDAVDDDARMVIEAVAGALSAGAVAVNRAEVLELLDDGERLLGARVRDTESGGEAELRAAVTLLCAGPWSGALLPGRLAGERRRMRYNKGVHLVLPGLGVEHAFLLTAPQDGRVFFLIPWYGRTLLGTTDTDCDPAGGPIDVNGDDVDYLLTAAGAWLARPWTAGDALGAFAGVRTLKATRDDAPSRVTREWELHRLAPGLLLPIGGKYTSARADSARAVDRVLRELGRDPLPCATAGPSPWAPAEPGGLEELAARGAEHGLDPTSAAALARRYGTGAAALLERIAEQPQLAARIHPELPFCRAEIPHAIECEMARGFADLFRRRIPLSILARPERSWLDPALADACAAGGWSEQAARAYASDRIARRRRLFGG